MNTSNLRFTPDVTSDGHGQNVTWNYIKLNLIFILTKIWYLCDLFCCSFLKQGPSEIIWNFQVIVGSLRLLRPNTKPFIKSSRVFSLSPFVKGQSFSHSDCAILSNKYDTVQLYILI